MLRSKCDNELAACSCRTKAETLARSLNSRSWPGTWEFRIDGERNGAEKMPEQEDEEFFETSPSPVEDEEHIRGIDSSAATVAGRAKLYELLQQHAGDDATEVFYDVSDITGSTASSKNVEGNLKYDGSSEKLFFYPNCTDFSNDSNPGKLKIYEPNMTLEKLDSVKTDEDVICNIKKSEVIEKLETADLKQNEFQNLECDFIENSIHSEKITINCLSLSSNSLQNLTHENFEPNTLYIKTFNSLSVDDTAVNIDVNNLDKGENEFSFEVSKCTTSKNLSLSTSVNVINDIDRSDLGTVVSPVEIHEQKASPTKCTFSGTDEDDINELKDPRRLKVFDDIRPMISRSTSLKTGKTPPGTPSRKKIVRFADVLGLDLEDVRHIISGDIPEIPMSAYSDLELEEEDKPRQSTSTTVVLNGPQHQNWENIRTAIGPHNLYPKFPIPGQQINFWDRVQAQGICLESVNVSDSNVQCTCRVMNWGFHKKVIVRYTTNAWTNSSDIDASFVAGSSKQDTDGFTFNIFLPLSCKNVEFALSYEVNGKKYWDNNYGENYAFSSDSYMNSLQVSQTSSPTFVHQFW